MIVKTATSIGHRELNGASEATVKKSINDAFRDLQKQPEGSHLKIFDLVADSTYLRDKPGERDQLRFRLEIQLAGRAHEYRNVYGTLDTRTGEVEFGDAERVFRQQEAGGYSVLPGQTW